MGKGNISAVQKEDSVKDIIKLTARATATEVVVMLKTENLVKDKKNPFQKVEQLLYNYKNFKNVINDKAQQINDIKTNGLSQKSKSITSWGGNTNQEFVSDSEKEEDKISEIEKSIALTKYFIKVIDSALLKITDDPYYDLIVLLYFEGKSREEIAEYYACDISTVWRNKRRLINQLKIILFSDDVISEMFYA